MSKAVGDFVEAVLLSIVTALIAAWALMLLVPLLGVVGLPATTPGYRACVAFVVLGRLVLTAAGDAWRTTARPVTARR